MPDTKLTRANLSEHLRKYSAIYLVGIAVCMLVTSLLWTMTRPQIPTNQSLIIYLVTGYSNPDFMDDIAADMLTAAQAADENMLEVDFQGVQFSDDGGDYTSSMVLMTRMAVGECDAFLANQAAMDMLVGSDAVAELDTLLASGWLSEYDLEPYVVTVEDEEAGTSSTFTAGLRLDGVDALVERGVMNNEGAFLCLAINGDNPEATYAALEVMFAELTGRGA